VQRRTANTDVPSTDSTIVHQILRSSGQSLNPNLQQSMESRFGRDFSQIRIHTDQKANQSAQSINAQAYASGKHIVFGVNQYQPTTDQGRKLIAHELTHTIQQSSSDVASIQRVVNFDITRTSITPELVAPLNDAELTNQLQIVQQQITTLDRNSAEYHGAIENRRVLEQEIDRRTVLASGVAANASIGPQVSRPTGLPMEGGYTLQALPHLPQTFMDQIPEGQLVTVTEEMLRGNAAVTNATSVTDPPRSPIPTASSRSSLPPLGNSVTTSIGAGYVGMEANLLTYGLPLRGTNFGNSIGIVSFPRYSPSRIFSGLSSIVPEHPVMWGHTAVIVRMNGRIVSVVSHAPSSLLNAGFNRGVTPAPILEPGISPAVRTGTAATPAAYYNDRAILLNSKLRSLEIEMPPAEVEAFLGNLPRGQTYGVANPVGNSRYTAIPSEYYGSGGSVGSCPNCIDWAVPTVEEAIGGTITSGNIPVTDLPANTGAAPVPHQANQGQLMRALADSESLAVLGPDGVPIPRRIATGGLTPGMQVLKWGGRIMIVYAAYQTYAEIRDAPEGTRRRTAAGAISGFAGGLAAGALAGLACGPGAPVCSIVLGLGFGIAGTLIARDVGELSYDAATGEDHPLYTTLLWRAMNQPVVDDADIPRTVCSGQANCHTPARYLSPNWRQRDSLLSSSLARERVLSEADITRLLEFVNTTHSNGH
jgi:Domain of unknown function (DUF4157)